MDSLSTSRGLSGKLTTLRAAPIVFAIWTVTTGSLLALVGVITHWNHLHDLVPNANSFFQMVPTCLLYAAISAVACGSPTIIYFAVSWLWRRSSGGQSSDRKTEERRLAIEHYQKLLDRIFAEIADEEGPAQSHYPRDVEFTWSTAKAKLDLQSQVTRARDAVRCLRHYDVEEARYRALGYARITALVIVQFITIGAFLFVGTGGLDDFVAFRNNEDKLDVFDFVDSQGNVDYASLFDRQHQRSKK